jgi:hypothetical protein
LTGISCPGVHRCIAVDEAGDVLSSGDPGGAVDVWRRAEIYPGHALRDIACPSAILCVAVGDAGTLFTSTDPTGGAGAWSAALVDSTGYYGGGPPALRSVTCASSTFCQAVDETTQGVVSTDPTGGPSAWQTESLPGFGARPAASCPSSQLCVLANRFLWASTDPAGGRSGWPVQSRVQGGWQAVECPSTVLCVVSQGDHGAFASQLLGSTAPTGGELAWHDDGVDPVGVVMSISWRPGSTACVAVDNRGRVLTSR